MAYTTRRDLLQKVHENQDSAYRSFERFYRPMILLRARDLKLRACEIDELKQNVLLAVFRNDVAGQYDVKQGRFRDFLRRIITNCAIDILRARKKEGYSRLGDDIADKMDNDAYEQEWREYLVKCAKAEVREACDPSTYMAYLLYAERGMPVKKVSEMLQMNAMQIYQAKTRVIHRMQTVIQRMLREMGEPC